MSQRTQSCAFVCSARSRAKCNDRYYHYHNARPCSDSMQNVCLRNTVTLPRHSVTVRDVLRPKSVFTLEYYLPYHSFLYLSRSTRLGHSVSYSISGIETKTSQPLSNIFCSSQCLVTRQQRLSVMQENKPPPRQCGTDRIDRMVRTYQKMATWRRDAKSPFYSPRSSFTIVT